ncbi:hypothetical protein N182_37490 [Sinorhizobium sp. GL2]|nr:hypothetical protein N182_37490 [Sinorhizobium sp. GL2]
MYLGTIRTFQFLCGPTGPLERKGVQSLRLWFLPMPGDGAWSRSTRMTIRVARLPMRPAALCFLLAIVLLRNIPIRQLWTMSFAPYALSPTILNDWE